MVKEKKRILDLEEAIVEVDKQITTYQKNLQVRGSPCCTALGCDGYGFVKGGIM